MGGVGADGGDGVAIFALSGGIVGPAGMVDAGFVPDQSGERAG